MPIDRLEERKLLTIALRKGAAGATELARLSGLAPRSVLRALAEQANDVVVSGKAGRRRYALRQPIRQNNLAQAVYAIDALGHASYVTDFNLVQPHGSQADLSSYCPMSADVRDGWWEGLPYPLYAMQPQGFLGRNFARMELPHLGDLGNPRMWSDETIAHVLAHRAPDVSGNLILGDASLRLFQQSLIAPPPVVAHRGLKKHYAACAEASLGLGLAGSSAAGEFPKFTALRELGGSDPAASHTPHVIVKFSGIDTPRWSDLLRLEWLALKMIGEHFDIEAASTRLVEAGGRVFLESERFDRVGLYGRTPLVSMQAASDHLLGLPSQDWPDHAKAFAKAGLLTNLDAERIELLWWFGKLIGNTDMHLGNVSLRFTPNGFTLAPIYDMLPMAYSPLPTGELPRGDWQPPMPLPQQAALWRKASTAALTFWQEAERMVQNDAFKIICKANAQKLERLSSTHV